MPDYRVYLGSCSTYDPDGIKTILQSALKELPLDKPITGNVVIKPNLVMAHPKVATDGYSRPEVIEAILRFIHTDGKGVASIDIVEKSGLGVTTASMFRWAGYRKLIRKYPVHLRAMEERPQSTVVLHKGKVHTHLTGDCMKGVIVI